MKTIYPIQVEKIPLMRLLQKENVNLQAGRGKVSLLDIACAYRQPQQFIDYLLALGANPNLKNNKGGSALRYAIASAQNEEIISTLLKAGGNLFQTDNDGCTPLISLTKYLFSEDFYLDVLKRPEVCRHVNDQTKYGDTLLILALRERNCTEKVLQEILNLGANVDILNRKQSTALMYAVQCYGDGFKKYLKFGNIWMEVDQKAYPHILNIRPLNVQAAYCRCYEKMHISLISRMIAQSHDIDQQNQLGATALMLALEHRCLRSILLELIEKSKNLDLYDEKGCTALIRACLHQHSLEVLIKIIEKSESVNHQNQLQCSAATALITSSRDIRELKIALEALLLKGGNPNQINQDGNNWLSLIILERSESEAMILIDVILEKALMSCSDRTLSKAIEVSEAQGASEVTLTLKSVKFSLLGTVPSQIKENTSNPIRCRVPLEVVEPMMELSSTFREPQEEELLSDEDLRLDQVNQVSERKSLVGSTSKSHPLIIFSEASILKEAYHFFSQCFK